ncbi:hypothetical protein U9M48_033360 [Paspalum notatum var. saurae]|uniref:Uncharacterized protein n=1 Tax=Paspalum notatum var. saurae TaxID=547442 RepID=A0AAQ3X6I2_PASNO
MVSPMWEIYVAEVCGQEGQILRAQALTTSYWIMVSKVFREVWHKNPISRCGLGMCFALCA